MTAELPFNLTRPYGLERIAMARYGIPEIRLFLENDVRFLSRF